MIQPINASEFFRNPYAWKVLARRLKHGLNKDQNPRNFRKVTRQQYKQYFKCAIIRNPWSRVHSAWRNVVRDEQHFKRLGLSPNTSLYEFVSHTKGVGFLQPQTAWLLDLRGNLAVDYVGRFEELEKSFDHICNRLHLPTVKLPHEIKGPGKDYRESFDEQSRRLVAEFFAPEIEIFGYTFDA
jgi:hypothetical protein